KKQFHLFLVISLFLTLPLIRGLTSIVYLFLILYHIRLIPAIIKHLNNNPIAVQQSLGLRTVLPLWPIHTHPINKKPRVPYPAYLLEEKGHQSLFHIY